MFVVMSLIYIRKRAGVYYAGIFDAGLPNILRIVTSSLADVICHKPAYIPQNQTYKLAFVQ